ncbi:MAG: methionine--tRNA ligase [Candidatus Paceibacterota bacterium]|jgi:methionyl-tRNA synthetase
MSKKKFYITTSIAYANASPHIGYAMEVLQADALARFHRLLGEDVYFLSGTDENGSKIKKTAEEKNIDVQRFVDGNSDKFRLLLGTLNVSIDDFIRTSDKVRHYPSAQKIWKKFVDAGDIYKNSYEGLYCVGCEEFITEKDLIDGKCPNHKKEPERVKEDNYFFRLSKYTDRIRERIESGEINIIPESRKNEILSVLREGLRDISFSRSKRVLDWGIPIPGDDDQTMYVWCDALTNYISALGYAEDSDKYKKYWPADVHLIGKDILRFHSAIWPGMLLSADLALPKNIYVHGFITSGGQKMSKSLGNVIDPFEVVEKYGSVDALRYYLLKEISSSDDGDFSYAKFEELYQADLANGIGNLTARILTLASKMDTLSETSIPPDTDLERAAADAWLKYFSSIDLFKMNESLLGMRAFMSMCDEYLEKKKPWKMEGADRSMTIFNLLECMRHIAWMIRPFMPETSDKIFSQLFADEKERTAELSKNIKDASLWGRLKPGTKIKKGDNLFPRLDK